jgi:hypothetical protein
MPDKEPKEPTVDLQEVLAKLDPTERKLFLLRLAAYEQYKTVAKADKLIKEMGAQAAAQLSVEEFLTRLSAMPD